MTLAATGNALALPRARIAAGKLVQAGSYARLKILQFIVKYKTEHDGNSPSSRQICDSVGISSTAVVHYHLRGLERQGKISIIRGTSRQIVVTGGHWSYRETKGNAPTDVLPIDP